MMASNNVRKLNPRTNANIISLSIFWWLKDFVSYGSKHDLQLEDLYDTMNEDKSEQLGNNLEKAWLKECEYARRKGRTPNFLKCALKLYGKEYCKYTMIFLLVGVLQMIQPLSINMVLPYFDNPAKTSSLQAYSFASASVFLLMMIIILRDYIIYKFFCMGMHIRTACSSLIFRKALRVPCSFESRSASDSMVNLLSNDLQRFEMTCAFTPFLFIIPIQIILTLYLISGYVSITAACVAIIVILIQALPVQAIYYKIIAKLRLKQTTETDKRVSYIREILSSMRLIKVYAWEQYFKYSVSFLRKNEITTYMNMSYATSVILSMMHFIHRWSIYFLTLTCIFQNIAWSSVQIIPVMQYLSTLRENLNFVISNTIKSLADAAVTVRRLEAFLAQEEIDAKAKMLSDSGHEKSIKIKAVTTSWNSENCNEVLKDITLEIEHGKLFVVIGPVGCGKTSLLKLILGEMTPKTGDIFVNGKVSYASQEPWIFSGSIRDNILFGNDYNEPKYKQVISSCALLEDFFQLPYGDKTLVGEKGMSLSGGQCARINLARAVYRNVDIYLLDDALSAVDRQVAKKLFDDCIDGLLKDKTRILITHNREYLDRAHAVILMDNGTIHYQGSKLKIQSLDPNWTNSNLNEMKNLKKNRNRITAMKYATDLEESSTKIEDFKSEPQENEEFLAKGSISKSVIPNYIKASNSYFLFSCWIFSIIFVIFLCAGFDYSIVLWSQQQEVYNSTSSNVTNSTTNHSGNSFLVMFGTLVITITIMSIFSNVALFKFMLNGSKNIHNSMFDALIHTPLKFFEINPAGRIMNRFTEDVGTVDDLLLRCISQGSNNFIESCAFLLPVLIINWWHSISMIIIGIFIFKIYNLCAPTLRGTLRLAAIAKSSVLSFAIASSDGKETIRSQNARKVVDKMFNSRQDVFTAAYSLCIACNAAFATWLNLLTVLLFTFVIYVSLLLKSSSESAGFIGLALIQISNLSVYVSITVRLLIFGTYGHLVNIERMFQITELEQEECSENLMIQLPKTWPTKGEIQFVGLFLKYSDDGEPILKNVNLTIESLTKVGIVGRTGAGKSSLISALFRLTKIEGTILIDGIDTKNINLKELRSKISIIPQEPILFSASLRTNLDPFNEFDDAKLWAALESVELKKTFLSLDYVIEKGGCNLSLGQRQLVCLARAIIRNNKILILDEATANIDAETDALIQKTIRAQLKNCTIITIAHKINTVMDCDKILVMNNGQVVEYDSPSELLKNSDGYFYKMVQQGNVEPKKET